jgi:hypothetical protein
LWCSRILLVGRLYSYSRCRWRRRLLVCSWIQLHPTVRALNDMDAASMEGRPSHVATGTPVEIYWISGSPFSWRVMLTVEVKGVLWYCHGYSGLPRGRFASQGMTKISYKWYRFPPHMRALKSSSDFRSRVNSDFSRQGSSCQPCIRWDLRCRTMIPHSGEGVPCGGSILRNGALAGPGGNYGDRRPRTGSGAR